MKREPKRLIDPQKLKQEAMVEDPEQYKHFTEEQWEHLAEQLAALARLVADFVKTTSGKK